MTSGCEVCLCMTGFPPIRGDATCCCGMPALADDAAAACCTLATCDVAAARMPAVGLGVVVVGDFNGNDCKDN